MSNDLTMDLEGMTKEEMIEELRKENLRLRHMKIDAEAELTEFQMDCQHLKRLNEDFQTDIARLKKAVVVAGQEREDMNERYLQQLEELQLPPAELARVRDQYKAEAREFREDVEAQERQLKSTKRVLEDEAEALQRDCRRLELKLEQKDRDIQDEIELRRKNQRKADSLREEKGDLDRKLESEKIKLASSTITRVNTVTEIETCKSKTTRLEGDIKRERRKSSAVLSTVDLSKLDFGEADAEEGALETPAFANAVNATQDVIDEEQETTIVEADESGLAKMREMLQSSRQSQSLQQTLDAQPGQKVEQGARASIVRAEGEPHPFAGLQIEGLTVG